GPCVVLSPTNRIFFTFGPAAFWAATLKMSFSLFSPADRAGTIPVSNTITASGNATLIGATPRVVIFYSRDYSRRGGPWLPKSWALERGLVLATFLDGVQGQVLRWGWPLKRRQPTRSLSARPHDRS